MGKSLGHSRAIPTPAPLHPALPEAPAHSESLTKDELNLAEYPFALLSDRAPKGLSSLSFVDSVIDKDGREIERKWLVNGSDAYGLPTSSDEPVYLALMQIGREQGFNRPTITFIFADLLRRLGLSDDGRSYKRVRASLLRLTGVQITADKSFFDKSKGKFSTKSFHILDSFEINGGPGQREASYVRFSEELFGSIQAGALNTLDFSVYLSLDGSVARRLYRYLDKVSYDGKDAFRIGIRKLGFEKLGMCRGYFPSQIKRILDPAHEELMRVKFLSSVRYHRGREEELVVYTFAKGSAEFGDAVEALLDRGVSASASRKLVSDHGLDRVWRHIRAFDRLATQGRLKASNPGGWLRSAIEHDYIHPDEAHSPVQGVLISVPETPDEAVSEADWRTTCERLPASELEQIRERVRREVMARPMFAGRPFSGAAQRLAESITRQEAFRLAKSLGNQS